MFEFNNPADPGDVARAVLDGAVATANRLGHGGQPRGAAVGGAIGGDATVGMPGAFAGCPTGGVLGSTVGAPSGGLTGAVNDER